MGCTDRGSNYNALVYNEKTQKWGAFLSWDRVSYEAPTKEMVVEELTKTYGPSLEDWDLAQLESGSWKAVRKTLLGAE